MGNMYHATHLREKYVLRDPSPETDMLKIGKLSNVYLLCHLEKKVACWQSSPTFE